MHGAGSCPVRATWDGRSIESFGFWTRSVAGFIVVASTTGHCGFPERFAVPSFDSLAVSVQVPVSDTHLECWLVDWTGHSHCQSF